MEAGIFSSSMSLLVNGSPAEEFLSKRGLRQGDPLSSFLFAIVAEGLAIIVNQAVSVGMFRDFKINDIDAYSLLQFANDTIMVGEGSWLNVWSLKVILRGFEMVSSFRINMAKRKLYGVGVDQYFLVAVAQFLSCKIDSIPFKFHGIMVGGNYRRVEFWKPITSKLREKLSY